MAEISYAYTYGAGLAVNIPYLSPPAPRGQHIFDHCGLIHSVLASGVKSGYSFTYSPGAHDSTGRINTFSFTAVP